MRLTLGVDGMGMAEVIRSGTMSAEEACRDAIERIERDNPVLNAVVTPLFARALAQAPSASGPFGGVPLLLKDVGASLAGLPHYQGNRLLRRIDWRAKADDPLLRLLVDAGLVVMGKTNTPEFAAGVATQPLSFGPTRNPWHHDYSTSGSSGGSAAAVAAGLVAIAHGNDFGGSIRLPAAWCGVIGLKPSRGRVSTHPSPPGANAEFVLTRSLRDVAAVLDVVADPGMDPVAGRWFERHTEEPPRCRIGVVTSVDGVETEPEATERATEAAAALAAAGHDIVELDGAFLGDPDWDAMQLVVRARGARGRLKVLAELAGRPLDEDDAEPLMLALAALAPSFTETEANEAAAWQLSYADRLAARWRTAGLDAVVTPTTGLVARRIVEMAPPEDDPIAVYDLYRRIGCFAGCWNMTGQPAISIPWWTPPADELPHGVQVVAGLGNDLLVLQLAHQLSSHRADRTEVRRPPNVRRPG